MGVGGGESFLARHSPGSLFGKLSVFLILTAPTSTLFTLPCTGARMSTGQEAHHLIVVSSLCHLANALHEFRALETCAVSLDEGVETSTPNGRLVFGIFAGIGEFKRELIWGCVRTGLALARSRGRHLGRPRIVVDASRVASLRAKGQSWAAIPRELGIGRGTAQRAALRLPKNPSAQDVATA